MHPEDAETSDVILGLNKMVLIHFIESVSSLSKLFYFGLDIKPQYQ